MKKINSQILYDAFIQKFDVVGIIETKNYQIEAQKRYQNFIDIKKPTMIVVGLSYPYRVLKHTHTHLVPSFYTFGKDYHSVLKRRMEEVLKPLDIEYETNVDNHPYDERLAATLAGIGYFGKNQLIINQTLGSYFFLGLVFLDVEIESEIILEVNDDCGSCHICLDACPTKALSEDGYEIEKCMSFYNQAKKVLTKDEMDHNYSLFGCDICQIVCPKNIHKGKKVHPEFELNGKEMVSIVDLFTDSDAVFHKKYDQMSYFWKGKTILMRNALVLLRRMKNNQYNDLIKQSRRTKRALWYEETAELITIELEEIS